MVLLSLVACAGPVVEEPPPVVPDVPHAEVAWVFEKPPISADLVDRDDAYDLSCMARAEDQIFWFSGGAVWAVNAATGALNWSNAFSPSPSLCYDTPAVDSERIYIEQYESVVALNLADGSLAWVSEVLPVIIDWSYCHGQYSEGELQFYGARLSRPLSVGAGVLAMPSSLGGFESWGGVLLLDSASGATLLRSDEFRGWGHGFEKNVVPPIRQGWLVRRMRDGSPVHLSSNGENWVLSEVWGGWGQVYSDGDTRMDALDFHSTTHRFVRSGLEMDLNSHRSLVVEASHPSTPPEVGRHLYLDFWNAPWGYGPDYVLGIVPSRTDLETWVVKAPEFSSTHYTPALVRYTGLSSSPDWVFREPGFVSALEVDQWGGNGPTVSLPVVDDQVFFMLSNLQQVSEEGALEALQIDGQSPNSVLVVVDATTGELAWLGLTEGGVPGVVFGDLENSLNCPPVVTDEHVIVAEPHRITAFRRLR